MLILFYNERKAAESTLIQLSYSFYSIGLPFLPSSLSSVDRQLVHSCTFVKIVEYTVSSVVKPLYIHSHSFEAVPLVFELHEFSSFFCP